jgi:hypothetical protein
MKIEGGGGEMKLDIQLRIQAERVRGAVLRESEERSRDDYETRGSNAD